MNKRYYRKNNDNLTHLINNYYSQTFSMKSQSHTFKQAQTTVQFLLGPIKIKDGLFMGDQFAAKDIEFIISNKVTHIINTVSRTIPNLYQRFGIQYLSVHWGERQENIFDRKNNAVNAIFDFVQQAVEAGQSCLIHSLHGKSRATAVLTAYLMRKYSWTLSKCLEFIGAKKQGLQVRSNYLSQMQELERRFAAESKLSIGWNQIKNQEDLLLANTFYNSKKSENKGLQSLKKNSNKKVSWNQKLVQKTIPPSLKDKQENIKDVKLKSILKGETTEQQIKVQKAVGQQPLSATQTRFGNTINANIVHVTVNNFISTQKKTIQDTPVKMYNTRPFSSDAKDRERKIPPTQNKLLPYESSMSTTFKNPYQTKLIGLRGRKKEETRAPIMTNERPISAGQDKKKGAKIIKTGNPLIQKLGYDIGMGSSIGKKRIAPSGPGYI